MTVRITLLFLLLGAIWGSAWLLRAEPYSGPPLLAAGTFRFALSAVLLGVAVAFQLAFRRGGRGQAATALPAFWRSSAMLGTLLLALPYACSAAASRAGVAAGLPGAIYAAMPLAVVLLLEEDVPARMSVLLLGFTGVSLLVIQGLQLDLAHWRGELLLLSGMVANAAALAYVVRGGRERIRASASLAGCAVQCAVAAGLLALATTVDGQWPAGGLAATGVFHAFAGILSPAVVVEAVISSITLPMMYLLLRRAGGVPVAAVQWLVTLTGFAEAAWFLGLRLIWENWAGCALIAAAVVMLLREAGPEWPADL
jgi:drug/metabolite transporter (DMT)-like permease